MIEHETTLGLTAALTHFTFQQSDLGFLLIKYLWRDTTLVNKLVPDVWYSGQAYDYTTYRCAVEAPTAQAKLSWSLSAGVGASVYSIKFSIRFQVKRIAIARPRFQEKRVAIT